MATCRTCAYLRKCIKKATKEGYEHNVNFDPKDGCTGIGYKSNTNADRIRAMSDEELAVFFADEIPHGDCYGCDLDCIHNDKGNFEDSCQNAWYGWLKQPAEG